MNSEILRILALAIAILASSSCSARQISQSSANLEENSSRDLEIVIDTAADLDQVGTPGSCFYSPDFVGLCKTPNVDPGSSGFWSSCLSNNCEISIIAGRIGDLGIVPSQLKISAFNSESVIMARCRVTPDSPIINLAPTVPPTGIWSTVTVSLTGISGFNPESEIILRLASSQLPSNIDVLDSITFVFPDEIPESTTETSDPPTSVTPEQTSTETPDPPTTTKTPEPTSTETPDPPTTTETPEPTSTETPDPPTTILPDPEPTTPDPDPTTERTTLEYIIDDQSDLSSVGELGSCVHVNQFPELCKVPATNLPGQEGFWSSCWVNSCELSVNVSRLESATGLIPTRLQLVAYVSGTEAQIVAGYRHNPTYPTMYLNPIIGAGGSWATTTFDLQGIPGFDKESEIVVRLVSALPGIHVDVLDKIVFTFQM